MNDFLVIISSILGSIVGVITLARFIFYTKAEIDGHIRQLENKCNTEAKELRDNLETVKETAFEKLLEVERNNNKAREEIYDKLAMNKESFENYMQQFMGMITEIKQEDKDLSVQFITLLNNMKDELKNDYTSRYNDLLVLINSKVNESDFTRLEQKFDKLSEVITELKTIVQFQLKEKDLEK